MTTPASAAARWTGSTATAVRPLGSDVHEVDLANGDVVVVKRHGEPAAVRAEVASLAWLAVPAGPPVPRVRGHDEHRLVVDRVAPGPATPHAAEELGRRLAGLHAAGAPAFGAPPPGGPAKAFIGGADLPNQPARGWPEWFAEHRVAHYVRQAVDRHVLTPAEARVVEAVPVAAPDEPPARLHGDLWHGNVLWAADGRAWLIDPAAHGGHRETDLAMLALFGCAHLDRVLAAYHEARPLADGWRDRVPLHQLFPLLVHAVLFGRGYAEQALAAARALR
ncbi:fructosamine kinase family protein [Saccharothrix obliqua]|uniref:fructosamine kinase family protein n=1 Tax=Saccharothrix obliqua TaxID=2861747 RepID=UPI0027E31664|nr:fructosamine kinase family protein [Saccharothrix obliqua]